MSQEEWVEKKRQDRPEEFAPLPCLPETTDNIKPAKHKIKSNFFTSKKLKLKPKPLHGNKNEIKHIGPVIEGIKKTTDKCDYSLLGNHIEEVCYGPTLEDQKPNSLDSVTSSAENKTEEIWYGSTLEICKKDSYQGDTALHNKTEEGPSVKNWKPTSQQIDALLSKAKATCSSCPAFQSDTVSLENKNNKACYGPILEDWKETSGQNNVASSVSVNLKSRSEEYEKQIIKDHTNESYSKATDTKVEKTHQKVISSGKYLQTSKTNNKTTNLKQSDLKMLEDVSCLNDFPSAVTSSINHEVSQQNTGKRKWAEIAPPASMLYYIDNTTRNKRNTNSSVHLADSISVGLKYLKTRTEEKDKTRVKGLLDIM